MINRKQIAYIILGYALRAIVAVSVAVAIIFFASRQTSKIGDDLRQQRALSYALERRSQTAQELKKDFEIIGNNDEVIEKSIPSADNILEFIGILESLAQQQGIQQSYSFGLPTPLSDNDRLVSIDYTLSLRSNAVTLTGYLNNFQRLPYFTGITSLNLSAATNNGWLGDSAVTLPAKLFARPSDTQ